MRDGPHAALGAEAAGVAVNLATCWMLPAGVVWYVFPIFVYCIGSSLMMPSVTLRIVPAPMP